MKKFIVIISPEYIRDAQVFVPDDSRNERDDFLDTWEDLSRPAYLGFIEARNWPEAIQLMADKTGYPVGIMEAIAV